MEKIDIIYWNVHSLEYKLSEPDVVNFLCQYDVICLCETWFSDHTDIMQTCLPGYQSKMFNRRKVTLQGRNSGGLLVLWKLKISNDITFLDYSSEHVKFKIGERYLPLHMQQRQIRHSYYIWTIL